MPTRRRPSKAKAQPKRRLPSTVTKPSSRRGSVALVVRDPNGFVPQPHAAPLAPWALSEAPMMSASFIGTFTLTEQQIQALRRPVEDTEVEWRAARREGAPEIPYLPHNGVRDRLDAAFGLGGWGMMPIGAPKEKDDVVYVPFALVVGGQPRVYVWGEQYYDSKNKQMTYGDALTGCESSAILRAGKGLGVARDLWSRRYIAALKQRVPVSQRGLDAGASSSRPSPPARTESEQEHISPKQRARLNMIRERMKRTPKEMREYLQQVYRVKSSRDLLQRDYAAACAAVEAPGPLPTLASLLKKTLAREPDAVLPPEAPLREGDIGWGLK